MDPDQFREAAHAAIEDIISYYQSLPTRKPLSSVSPGYLRPRLPPTAPTQPEPWPAIQADIERHIVPGLTHWQSPNFMAFFPANSSFPGMLGELYSAAFTAPAFNWLCSPAVTELETIVLDWLAQALGLPDVFLSRGEGGGVIQGSASEAVVTVMVAARERMLARLGDGLQGEERQKRIDEGRGRLVALGSEQAHSSTQKAAIIAGTRYRSVPARREDGFAMTGRSLRRAVEECGAEGLQPYFLTVSLGTTSTCAVDRFEEIAEVKRAFPELWVHVDAAYAGAALVCEEHQHLAEWFGEFESFDMNMHKWLLTNFDASCLFVRKRSELTSALSITPSYLRNSFSDSGLVTDYRDWQIPLGRRFRALKVWFVFRSYGLEGLRAHVRKHVALGELFHGLVRARPDLLAVLAGPSFALTVITVVPRRAGPGRVAGADGPDPGHESRAHDLVPDAERRALLDADEVTKEVYERVNSRGEIFLTSGVIDGTYAIRVVAGSPMVEEEHVRRAFDILVETAEEVLEGKGRVGEVDGAREADGSA